MKLTINGELITIDLETKEQNLSFLITKLGFNPKLIVVEFNGTILSPDLWSSQSIQDGDMLEIVTIVGGGA
ncbi:MULTISPECIES: sulfur carrier protein ThiS [unclassified Prochlorococcus]|uniref:sulfur carrier protein ThiS n=1 Tax=unclassified Prochlorococcus TaxID=2627481 RepID=UPI0005339C97|nr:MULTISPECIES: sulfur carrier protein ThiS [unclassified Prochlorococcus]KGG16296.1 Sulfur carrier protein ThiS [Prochlorococcus sp. MIT 0603]KGG17970.1 Sulfur carrier protein ThiS [Prochlorococcus sp. MIT 0602]